MLQYYHKNKVEINLKRKHYRKIHGDILRLQEKCRRESNPEAKRDTCKKYRIANRDKINASQRESYSKNKVEFAMQRNSDKSKTGRVMYRNSDKGKASRAAWLKTDRGRFSMINAKHRRRAKEKAMGVGITNFQWDEILRKYNFRCAYCGIKGNMTVDHVIPISKNGKHEYANIVPACMECNRSKHASLDWEPKIFKIAIGEIS